MTNKPDPLAQVEKGKQELRAEVTEIAARLTAARAEVATIYAELEQAVVRAESVLGATEVQRLAGFKSRSSVTSIVDRLAPKAKP